MMFHWHQNWFVLRLKLNPTSSAWKHSQEIESHGEMFLRNTLWFLFRQLTWATETLLLAQRDQCSRRPLTEVGRQMIVAVTWTEVRQLTLPHLHSRSLYIYIYMCVCVCVCVKGCKCAFAILILFEYIHVYIYIYKSPTVVIFEDPKHRLLRVPWRQWLVWVIFNIHTSLGL